MDDLLEVRGLTASIQNKTKKQIPIIEGISFSVGSGEIVGIVGESGCGKSMTALSIMQLLPQNMRIDPDANISLNGTNIASFSPKKMRKIRGNDISMIFQEPMTSLNPIMKIGRQITEIIQLHLKVGKNEAHRQAIALLESVGIPRAEAVFYEYPYQLSGGMRQRVMIAIAMACRPKLLIADEPTTALDVTIQAQILGLMKQLRNEYQTSIIMITHDLGVVAEMCDRVIIMYAGKIIETADVTTLFENPQHPYTKGLIQSLPSNGIGQKRLNSIPGNVPTIEKRIKGCRFAPRCPFAREICVNDEPLETSINDHHSSACWLNTPEKMEEGGKMSYGGAS